MAERHWVNGGGALNWSLAANWSLTEGGVGGQTVPSATEDVFFDAGSPNCTVNTSTRVCKTLTASAYTGTITFDAGINVSGNITIGSGVNFAGSTASKLSMIAAGTWTTNGKTIPQNILIGGTTLFTCTLADDLTTSGDLSLTNTTSTTFSGDFHLYAATASISGTQTVTIVHDVTISGLTTFTSGAHVVDGLYNWNTGGLLLAGTAAYTGTTTIVLTGGTISRDSTGVLSNKLTFAGNVTVSGTIAYAASGTPTITYVSGTITTTGSTLSAATSFTMDTEGMTWNSISLTGALTLTVSSALALAGDLTMAAATTLTLNDTLTVAGTMTMSNAAVTFNGTSGWTVDTLTHTTPTVTRIFTFEDGITYTVTSAMNANHTGAQTIRYTYTSSDAVAKAILTLGYGATQNIGFLNPTRIDSSLGQPVFSFNGVITESLNWSNDLGHGRIIPDAGGESVTVAGITKDNSGNALGSCDVYLFRDNGNDTATYIAYQESNAATGAYSFTVFPGSTYFVVAFKGGATPVMDVTDRTLVAA
jgi:hypothetical protein